MDLAGWTPIYSYSAARSLMLDWCYTGSRRFTEPFFGDTIDQLSRDRATLLFRRQTTVQEAAAWSRLHPGLPPAGFIFHMSRCGSTLASQMLGALSSNRVLSEPTAINNILRFALLDSATSREPHRDRLRTVVDVLGFPLPGETRYFVKLDCWHVLALPLFVEAFPATPWIFLYRDPAEVLISQARAPGAWTVPSALEPSILGLPGACGPTRYEYLARALARMCDAALQYRGMGRGLLVNYDQLPEFVCGPLLRHFELPLSPGQVDRMRSAARSDAKTPALLYSDDRPSKRHAVTPAMQALVEQWISPAFRRLEAAR